MSHRAKTRIGTGEVRRRWLVAVVAAAVSLAISLPAVGITDGTVDSGDDFPFVAVALDPVQGFLCSAGQIDELHLVTAAHCFQPALPPSEGGPPNTPVDIVVLFGPDATAPNAVIPGTWYPDEWCPFCGPGLPGFDNADIAVIKLEQPFPQSEYVSLAPEGLSGTLANKTDVMVAGYGVNGFEPGGGPLPENALFDGLRRFAPAELIASNHVHSDEYLKVTSNPSQGKGGTCFGDSGSPLMFDLDGEWVMLANTSYGTNGVCAGVGYYNRMDTAEALDFVASIRALP